jgi:hypothetical protein
VAPKKIANLTVNKFFEKAEREGEDVEVVKREILEVLCREGFSDEQLNKLTMRKAWELYLDSYKTSLERMETSLGQNILKHPEKATQVLPSFMPLINKLTEKLEKEAQNLEKTLEEKENN